jgi:radical SAM protein with 4Fe4S-binding SPASM domain
MKMPLIISAKNEEATIEDVLRSSRPLADDILVVDGHATDNTREIALKMGAWVVSDHGKGKGDAVRVGIQEAIGDILINVYPTSFYYGNTEHPITPREKEDILQQINRYRRLRRVKFHPISFLEGSYLKRIDTYLLTGLTPIPCHALRSSCFMDPSGNIFPCSMYQRILGNIRDHDYRLLSIWKSESAVQVQREIEDFHCPQCWTPCEAYQSILGNLAPRIFKVRKRVAYP